MGKPFTKFYKMALIEAPEPPDGLGSWEINPTHEVNVPKLVEIEGYASGPIHFYYSATSATEMWIGAPNYLNAEEVAYYISNETQRELKVPDE